MPSKCVWLPWRGRWIVILWACIACIYERQNRSRTGLFEWFNFNAKKGKQKKKGRFFVPGVPRVGTSLSMHEKKKMHIEVHCCSLLATSLSLQEQCCNVCSHLLAEDQAFCDKHLFFYSLRLAWLVLWWHKLQDIFLFIFYFSVLQYWRQSLRPLMPNQYHRHLPFWGP